MQPQPMVEFTLEELLKVARNILATVNKELQGKNRDVEAAWKKVNTLTNHQDPSLQERIQYEETLKAVLKEYIDFNTVGYLPNPINQVQNPQAPSSTQD
ncbi:hypothetical protein NDI44_20310 [Trichocoleus sp. DQ-A3]|uniref:hypothetical protein n=2 Tax=Cyanobacteriota TaxID=1117 RepID=UPI0016858C2E|nr:hypothetical protein [Coleofasciculus sp. FACHB-125]MBD1899786.1 hypothetical protein [Coleofasciculus sp. FACHB-125]